MTKRVLTCIFGITILSSLIILCMGFLIVAKMCYRHTISKKKVIKYENYIKKLHKKYSSQSLCIVTDDNILLSALLIERIGAKRTILLCHGYRCTKEKMRHYIRLFPHDNLLLFDFRNHGASGGSFTTFGYYEKYDVKAIIKFLRLYDKTKTTKFVGLGCSMGGAALLAAVADGVVFDALIIDSTFADLKNQVDHIFTARTGLPRVPFIFFIPMCFNYLGNACLEDIKPKDNALFVNCPILIIHSYNDTVIPVDHANIIYNNLQCTKKIWLVDDAEHGQSGKKYPQIYKKKIDKFLTLYGV